MNNLIITVIAIALVSVISLIGVFYAGPMISNNQYGAAAPAVIDLGQKVASAWGNFVADQRQANPGAPFPTSWAALVSGGYLTSVQEVPPMPGDGLNVDNNNIYNISIQKQGRIIKDDAGIWWYTIDVGRPTSSATSATNPNATVCLKTLTSALTTQQSSLNSGGPFNDATLTSPNNGNGNYGCFYWMTGSASPTTGVLSDNPSKPSKGGDYIFFYRLGS